ncbi:MAG: hypothetical protein AB2809_19765 [Candidatus Thiodiazotropha sp.]
MDWKNVVDEELAQIRARRELNTGRAGFKDDEHFFGIALSGGGVRSATICLGFLHVLQRCGVLQQVDYLSTVSGGGYIGAYIHSRLHTQANHDATDVPLLFADQDRESLLRGARYLTPGEGPAYTMSWIRFLTGIITSIVLNSIWIVATLACVVLLLSACWKLVPGLVPWVSWVLGMGAALVLFFHLVGHAVRQILPWPYDQLIALEAILVLFAVIYAPYLIGELQMFNTVQTFGMAFVALGVVVVVGFFSNPNVLGLHRFYRNRLADTYIRTGAANPTSFVSDNNKTIKQRVAQILALPLCELWVERGPSFPYAPYPLINTCVTLMSEVERRNDGRHSGKGAGAVTGIKSTTDDVSSNKTETKKPLGRRAADYFLLSPLYCGSKLTGYADTKTLYPDMKLSTAIAASGAAVNPGMGIHTRKLQSFVMALLGIRLGLWVRNPNRLSRPANLITGLLARWWPYYHILELLGRTDSQRPLVNLSDGGNIENLGVYELLRRRCRLIIAVDATADPAYGLSDLNNLILRARHELGIAIDFRDTKPEDVIRPKPSAGTSDSHFVVGTLSDLPEKPNRKENWGLIIYVKSSLRQQTRWRDLNDYKNWFKPGHDYKNNHPAFPHESTTDQFFDDDQWTAYYQLGCFIAGDVLHQDVRTEEWWQEEKVESVENLYQRFFEIDNFEKLYRYITPQASGASAGSITD